MSFSTKKIKSIINSTWDQSALPALKEFIKIPNQSPAFDKEWESNGLLDQAANLMKNWVQKQSIEGATIETIKHKGRTPLILIEVPGDSEETILIYGHLDKQPPVSGWESGLGPYKPVIKNGKLYGRGTVDDGYALFSAISAIKAVKETGHKHARCIIIIEASEESNTIDLPYYLNVLNECIGSPSLVVCLDSVCGDYKRLWVTTSLRGSVIGTLSVSLLKEGVHSGSGSGIVASSFRVTRQLLNRLEDPDSGSILPSEFHVRIPENRKSEAALLAEILGDAIYKQFPWQDGTEPLSYDLEKLILNQTWRPFLAVTGQDGIPPIEQAGNVIRPYTSLKLSLRLPPLVNPDEAAQSMKKILETDPPYGAKVFFDITATGQGWDAPDQTEWLSESLAISSKRFFGNPVSYMGVGGGIPLLSLLESQFPDSQFLVTGMIGPKSNPHGPNESLDLAGVKKLTGCIAQLIIDHYNNGLNEEV